MCFCRYYRRKFFVKMEKRILLEKRGRNPSEIKELVLDNCCSSSIVGFTDEFCNLEALSMVNVGLTNLKGFPKLPNLKKLELSDNRISGSLNQLTSNCPKLSSLHLGGNKIDSLEILDPLKELSNLKCLELANCEITSTENYREKVFKLLPNLKYLDGFDRNDKEIESEAENGKSNRWSPDENEDSEKESEESGDSDESDEEKELGLECLQEDLIDEESEGDDYTPEGEISEDDDIEDDSNEDDDEPKEEKTPRGEKRKLEESDD